MRIYENEKESRQYITQMWAEAMEITDSEESLEHKDHGREIVLNKVQMDLNLCMNRKKLIGAKNKR